MRQKEGKVSAVLAAGGYILFPPFIDPFYLGDIGGYMYIFFYRRSVSFRRHSVKQGSAVLGSRLI